MSAQDRQIDQAAGATGRIRAAGRARRAEQGAVTEMARLLLRDAREAAGAQALGRQAAYGHVAEQYPSPRVRVRRPGRPARLRSAPLAARSA